MLRGGMPRVAGAATSPNRAGCYAAAYVSAARYGNVVLWYYAFAWHWFKVNLSTDLSNRVECGRDS